MTGQLKWWRPVLAIEEDLKLLAQEGQGESSLGPARGRLRKAARCLPPGALTPERADALNARWPVKIGPPGVSSTSAPSSEAGTAYWLLDASDHRGLVLRLSLKKREPGGRVWTSADFWPMGVPSQDPSRCLVDTWKAAANWAGVPALDPPLGWHRLVLRDASPETLDVAGRSYMAALFAMLLSLELGQALPSTVAVTGQIEPGGEITLPPEALDGVRAKVQALARERGCVNKLLVPPGFEGVAIPGGPEVVVVRNVGELCTELGLVRALGVAISMSPANWRDEVRVVEAMATSRSAEHGVLHGRLGCLHATAPQDEATRAAWSFRRARIAVSSLLCEQETHHSQAIAADLISGELDRLLEDGLVQGSPAARARNVQASLAIDRRQFASARSLAIAALKYARQSGDREEEARAAGTAGRVSAHALRFSDAVAALEAALELQQAVIPGETNIVRSYLADALSRAGRQEQALSVLEQAGRENNSPQVSQNWYRHNASFLDYTRVKVLLAGGEPRAALEAAKEAEDTFRASGLPSVWPMAGLLARRVDAAMQLGERAGAERAAERLRDLDSRAESEIGALMLARAHATLLADSCGRGERPRSLSAVEPLLESLEKADQDSLVFQAAKQLRQALDSGASAALLGQHLLGLCAAEIY